jgi:hexosaminidase
LVQESFNSIPQNARQELSEELVTLIERFKVSWRSRNREGGLKESAGRLEHLLNLLQVK